MRILRNIASIPQLFARRPGADFTRQSKLPMLKTMLAVLSMGGLSLDRELLRLYNFNKITPTASAFVERHYTIDGIRTIHYMNGVFYGWQDNVYRPLDTERLRSELQKFLDNAVISAGKEGKTYPFPSKRSHIDNALDALRNVTYLPIEHADSRLARNRSSALRSVDAYFRQEIEPRS